MNHDRSQSAFDAAQKVLVGGVNSPVRAFAGVGGTPPFIACAKGSTITDVDGNAYVDYVGSYGPAILGHAAPRITRAIVAAAKLGTSFGAPTELEIELAAAVAAAVPSIEKVRFVNSGTEAVMTAIRLARGFTGRPKIIKCIGCYHGHSDAMLVSAGSGALTLGVPSSPGVPAGATGDTVLVGYNDLAAVEEVLSEMGPQVAAMLVEPVAGNMGVIPPDAGYLAGLRELCDKHGALLILDEVMTGFRLSYGGAQSLFGIYPDLTTLGKIIGGGMPVGAIGGRVEIMNRLSPAGPIYQAGTLSGNPIAMAAGLAALEALREEGFYERLEKTSATLARGLERAVKQAGLAGRAKLNRVGSMMTLFFAADPVRDYASATASDTKAFAVFFHSMLEDGVYLPPSQYEAFFVSAAHRPADIRKTIDAAERALAKAAALSA